MVHVLYRSAPPALADLIASQVQVMFDPVATSIESIRAGRLRPLAVTTSARSATLPDIPSVSDFLPGYLVHLIFRRPGVLSLPGDRRHSRTEGSE